MTGTSETPSPSISSEPNCGPRENNPTDNKRIFTTLAAIFLISKVAHNIDHRLQIARCEATVPLIGRGLSVVWILHHYTANARPSPTGRATAKSILRCGAGGRVHFAVCIYHPVKQRGGIAIEAGKIPTPAIRHRTEWG